MVGAIQIMSEMLNDEMLLYIRKCCRSKTTTVAPSPWAKFENLLHWYIIQTSRYTVSFYWELFSRGQTRQIKEILLDCSRDCFALGINWNLPTNCLKWIITGPTDLHTLWHCFTSLLQETDLPHNGLLHHLALSLMTHLHQGDEHIAHDLLSHVIFNQRYLGYEGCHNYRSRPYTYLKCTKHKMCHSGPQCDTVVRSVT